MYRFYWFLLLLLFLLPISGMGMTIHKDRLIDMPVSNHGARVRLILRSKGITDSHLVIQKPDDYGGLKSPQYLALNPQGKMPLLITNDDYVIIESDSIARYVVAKYSEFKPTFMLNTLHEEALSNQICRIHDIYISCVQGSMYKASGTVFSTFGTDRKAAMKELLNQLNIIENTIEKFYAKYPSNDNGSYLCGREISLADATLFPTIIFCDFMLPKYGITNYLGSRLSNWYKFMQGTEAGQVIENEILTPLKIWQSNGRFDPIIKELQQ